MPINAGLPLLLVDVDGVLSLFGDGLDVRSGAGRLLMVDGLPHFLSTQAGEHLRALAAHFELAWCTGWEDRANDHLLAVYDLLEPLPVLTFPERPADGAHWKLAGIDAYAGPDRALAWIDDALTDDCFAWAHRRPGATLLVPTQPAEGLTATETATLIAWAGTTTRATH